MSVHPLSPRETVPETPLAATGHPSFLRRWELPTWGLITAVYGGWGALTWFHAELPLWLLFAAGAWTVAWHMSMQHELLHGHPTRSRRINAALGFVPLSLWLPYERYRESHMAHHRDEHLTDPLEDPESYYATSAMWSRRGRLSRWVFTFNNTLAGRILIGPACCMVRFLVAEGGMLLRGDRRAWSIWAAHALGAAAVLYWVVAVCGMSFWTYALAFIYPGTSLALIRSFAEHRAAERQEHRTAIVERAPLLGLLFLNNNLHVVHHEKPGLPWYEIPAAYRATREDILVRNGGLVYQGYWDVFRLYFVRTHHQPVHPFHDQDDALALPDLMVIVQAPVPPGRRSF